MYGRTGPGATGPAMLPVAWRVMGSAKRDRRRATPYEQALGVVSVASSPTVLGDPALAATYAKDLANGIGLPGGGAVVNRAVLATLSDAVHALWQQGWQPADLARFTRREHGQAAASVVDDVVAFRMRDYPAAVVDPRWAAQVPGVWWDPDQDWVDRWADRHGVGRATAIETALHVVGMLRRLGPLPVLIPPPGSAQAAADPRVRGGRPAEPVVSTRALERIRALLAKAESTTFPEEAETYTAKAQELMARHSIDAALVDAGRSSSSSAPAGVRIGMDAPYEMAKSMLLSEVARANRCRSVWSKALGACTVFGFPTDLELVELLFTSLLVQATTALAAEGSRRDRHGRSSTRSFRQAFLTAYATRIGERLAGATDRAGRAAAAELGGSLLPVLAAREEAVQESFRAAFPNLVYREVTVSNADGYRSGRAAADRATLNPRRELS
jgi:hypothetical protein